MLTKFFLTAAAAALIFTAMPAKASDRHCDAASSQGSWLGLSALVGKLEAKGYRDIQKVERERRCYEVKALDAEGRQVKLAVDPVNGEILHSRMR